jgi:YesN/AraC family two-component response regulator
MQNTLEITKKLNVLFVDDEEMIREMMNEVLSETVGHLTLAVNGKEGLDIYTNSLRTIDIVITDQTMPIMKGLDMLTLIKEINPNQKCIMMTAHSEAEYMLRAIEIGIEHFLIKPIYFDKLDEIILDLANKIEEEKLAIEYERKERLDQVNHAFTYSLDMLVNNIPIPSMVIDQDDNILNYNDELACLMAGTPKYQQFIAKELKLNDIKDVSNDHGHPQFCDWKEEVIQLGNDLNCTIDSISYLVKIKKIVAEKLTRVYVVCLIQNTL